MKKNLAYIFILLLLFSCAVKKPEKRSNFLKSFYTKYNTLFNAEDALKTELEGRAAAHKDNFYTPYISLLTYDDDVEGDGDNQSERSFLGSTAATSSVPNIPSGGGGRSVSTPTVSGNGGTGIPSGSSSNIGNNKKSTSALEITEAKALKAIDKYSVLRDGQEKNKKIFDAYIALAKARIYTGKPLEALDALNQLFNRMKADKRLPLAQIYKGLAYAKLEDLNTANQIFADLKQTKDLKKKYKKILSIYYAEALLAAEKKDEAIEELEYAFDINSNRKLKSRIAFLRGQILTSQGKNEIARESFLSAYKYANDFEFEVKSQIEIAKTYTEKSDYSEAKKYLEKISRKGTYASRKNEFYYAIGLMAKTAGKKDEAVEYFRKSLDEKVSDPQIRGLDYYEIGKLHLENDEYIATGAYYDSALAVMTYEPTKAALQEQLDYIKKISKNYYLVKKNDSILALTKMSKDQLESYFGKYIAEIKAKEEVLERERLKKENGKGFDTGDYNANSIFAQNTAAFQSFDSTPKGFYFSNNNTISKGNSEFKQVWGNRALSDNWRYSSKMTTIEDQKNTALGLNTTPDPRRFETSFYIEKIPKDVATLANLKKERDTASLGLGVMYEDFFSNTPLATKTLYDLVDNKPEEEIMLQALYKIFAMNYKKNPSVAARAKQILLTDYPHTSYAEFARNPQSSSFINASPDAELTYKQAFVLYENEDFEQSKAIIAEALEKYPKDALVPKFTLLNAFNTGKTAGKEVMILQLEQIALNYATTSEGEKAKEMLNYLKSDLQIQTTDEKGNKTDIQNNVPPQMPKEVSGNDMPPLNNAPPPIPKQQ